MSFLLENTSNFVLSNLPISCADHCTGASLSRKKANGGIRANVISHGYMARASLQHVHHCCVTRPDHTWRFSESSPPIGPWSANWYYLFRDRVHIGPVCKLRARDSAGTNAEARKLLASVGQLLIGKAWHIICSQLWTSPLRGGPTDEHKRHEHSVPVSLCNVRHGGWADTLAWDEMEVKASTANSMVLMHKLISGSNSMARAHSLAAEVRLKQSLQHVLALATPVKQIE